MAKFGEGGDLVKCSFCGKTQKQVKKLIAGPSVYICDECIDLCNDIIRDEASSIESVSGAKSDLPTPQSVGPIDMCVFGIGAPLKAIVATARYQSFERCQCHCCPSCDVIVAWTHANPYQLVIYTHIMIPPWVCHGTTRW